jgi:hypothetical protein
MFCIFLYGLEGMLPNAKAEIVTTAPAAQPRAAGAVVA